MESDKWIDELYKLEIERKAIEAKEKEIKEKLLDYMTKHNVPKIPREGYEVIRANWVRYKTPDPAVVRRTLGPLADKYIHEVVDLKFRTAVSPEIANLLCPPDKVIPYIQLRLKANMEKDEGDKEETLA